MPTYELRRHYYKGVRQRLSWDFYLNGVFIGHWTCGCLYIGSKEKPVTESVTTVRMMRFLICVYGQELSDMISDEVEKISSPDGEAFAYHFKSQETKTT